MLIEANVVSTAIISAISSGVLIGAKDTAKEAVSDAYGELKSLIKAKFGRGEAVEAIDRLEANPNSDGRKQIVSEELEAVNADGDSTLALSAEGVLELIRALPLGQSHTQFAKGIGIAQAGGGSNATVTVAGPVQNDRIQ